MHAGAPVGAGCAKYCVRSDVMYERVPPRLTAPNERRAFETYQEALALEAAGDAMAALPLYMRVGKLSAEVARVFSLVGDMGAGRRRKGDKENSAREP